VSPFLVKGVKMYHMRIIWFIVIGILISISSVHAAPKKTSTSSSTTTKARTPTTTKAKTTKSIPTVQKDSKEALYDEGKKLADAKNYYAALRIYEKANLKYPNDPDILNMLAYSQRKTGSIDEAITNYKKALRLKSHFPEAREYLAEAYIQAAVAEIRTLRSYGSNAIHELEDVIKEFRDAARNL